MVLDLNLFESSIQVMLAIHVAIDFYRIDF